MSVEHFVDGRMSAGQLVARNGTPAVLIVVEIDGLKKV